MSVDTAVESSVEYRTCPWPVRLSAWILALWAGLVLVPSLANIFMPFHGIEITISKYTLNNDVLGWRIAAFAAALVVCLPVIGLSMSLLRGRMWAYYITVIIWLCVTGSYIVNHFYYHKPLRIGNLNFVVDLVLTIAVIASFNSYRKMIKYRRNTPRATPQAPEITTP